MITEYTCVIKMGKQVVFCWIPSHVGIPGNEKADSAAKRGLNKPVTDIRIAATDLYPSINELCKSEWQQSWNNFVGNKLYSTNTRLCAKENTNSMNRHDSTIIRIGHTSLTRVSHSYLLTKDTPTKCCYCHITLTVKHSYQLKDQCISVLPLSEICLIVWILVLLSTLLKTSVIMIAYSLVLPHCIESYRYTSKKILLTSISQNWFYSLQFSYTIKKLLIRLQYYWFYCRNLFFFIVRYDVC